MEMRLEELRFFTFTLFQQVRNQIKFSLGVHKTSAVVCFAEVWKVSFLNGLLVRPPEEGGGS